MLKRHRSAMRALITLFLGITLAACAGPRPSLLLTDAVIRDAVVWQGEVQIRGVVTVKKEGSLTILPGTRVVFVPLDEDGDGIGDGELLVEGALIARGTAAAPILFTSGAATPRPADWKFLYLDFAREVAIEYVVSEYAYSGIQVHFCKGRIAASEFRYNVDGVRFSTVNLEVVGNRIHHNIHGVRYEERRGTAYLHGNAIHDNDIGIFVVTRAENKTRIEGNNISGNRQYNVKLGLDQSADVSFPRNWWGSADPAAIAASFFDGAADPSLGRVEAPEPLTQPVVLAAVKALQGER
ncbi:MAG: hypothetical protein A2091_12565 [Desulfuromonadales bacterium GWD2_61_12]|nr:MAG: hypothetical protein A2091_12565 [Desulfuromonadales bacterium GWD2_61_12]HBT82940.1 hypothetical protein [Desulfuromonas sp.]